MTEESNDIDDAISRIIHKETCYKDNLDVSLNSLIEVLKRLGDKNLLGEYNSFVKGMANQINLLFESNQIALKRIELENAIRTKFSYEDYKKLMKKTITHLSKNQKEWKIAKIKVKK